MTQDIPALGWQKGYHEARCEAIKKASLAMDSTVLRAMVADGLLNLHMAGGSHFRPDQVVHAYKQWIPRVHAFMAFTQNTGHESQTVDVQDLGQKTHMVLSLKAADDFRAWFSEATAQLVTNWPSAMASVPNSIGKGEGMWLLSEWMACACMLNMPREVRAIQGIATHAADARLPLISYWGEKARVLRLDKGDSLQVSPVWVAWQFSSLDCLMAMGESVAMNPDKGIASATTKDWTCLRSVRNDITLANGLREQHFNWRCNEATYTAMVKVVSGSEFDSEIAKSESLNALRKDNLQLIPQSRVQSYVDAGIYQQHPTATILALVGAGMPTLVAQVAQSAEFHKLANNGFVDALKQHEPGQDLVDMAALKFILGLKEKEGLVRAKMVFWDAGNPATTPIDYVVSKKMDKLLIGLMAAGVVEPLKVEYGRPRSAMALAKMRGSALLGVMASWEARRTAHALLDGMDDAGPKKVTP